MDFESLVGLLQDPGDAVVPPTIYDDIRSQYNGLSENFSSAQAKINELTESNNVLSDQLDKMKAANYDLLTQVQSTAAPEKGEGDSESSEGGEDDGDDGGIDAFFDKRVEDEKE